ncbi:nitroreductase family protein [Advenella mimigardefordensis]|uniref:Putative nitroreductase n=1 Tax=Advenella mimigardefordensis (strain DSM 17166 / LMG 22922 / DPN7) TaxID=1247726 RepID=W0PCU1_ADVMD|nr:nitroreductase family protein [Advenella mimigardefordensis]AHG63292.1 putative nitroreductase [Advenella mimigardefordensis DPN7]
MSANVLQHLKNRRTIYALGRDVKLGNEELVSLIQNSIKQAPSSFNSQTSRAVVLLGKHQDRLWEIAKETLKAIVPADAYPATEAKLSGFQAAYGTVLFYEDQDVVGDLQKKFALYADNFPIWSEHSTGMAQLAVWTALAEHDIGASLQHYNPLIDDKVKAEWNIPSSWKLRAQMPFGSIVSPAGEKEYMNDEERFRVFA